MEKRQLFLILPLLGLLAKAMVPMSCVVLATEREPERPAYVRQIRLRRGIKNEKTAFFILFCARLSLILDKLGCVEA